MTPSEFKAWFDGFTEAVGDVPTPEQWKKIKAKVAEIRNEPKPIAPHLIGSLPSRRFLNGSLRTLTTPSQAVPSVSGGWYTIRNA